MQLPVSLCQKRIITLDQSTAGVTRLEEKSNTLVYRSDAKLDIDQFHI